jgi:hypothetical protein
MIMYVNNNTTVASGTQTLCALAMLMLAGPAQSLELSRALTRVDWVHPPDPGAPAYAELTFSAEISSLEAVEGDVVATWEIVGGIEPVPFEIIIPEGCFQRTGRWLQVRDFQGCGVKAVLETADAGQITMPIDSFSAVLAERSGVARLSISTAISTATEIGDLSSLVLGTVGGGRQSVKIGPAQASLLPNSVEVVGFDPQPEPPANPGRY